MNDNKVWGGFIPCLSQVLELKQTTVDKDVFELFPCFLIKPENNSEGGNHASLSNGIQL